MKQIKTLLLLYLMVVNVQKFYIKKTFLPGGVALAVRRMVAKAFLFLRKHKARCSIRVETKSHLPPWSPILLTAGKLYTRLACSLQEAKRLFFFWGKGKSVRTSIICRQPDPPHCTVKYTLSSQSSLQVLYI